MKRLRVIMASFVFTLPFTVAPLLATPTYSIVATPGNAISIMAKNTEDKAYTCTIRFTWSYMEYGNKVTQSVDTDATIQPHEEREIYRVSAAATLANVQLEGPVEVIWR